ncbi:MAG: FAD-binding protein [Candidatus Malihini olakiniferum]
MPLFNWGIPALIIVDKTNTLKMVDEEQMNDALKNGWLKTYNTLEEVEQAYDMPVAPFVEQVKRWNGYVEQYLENDPDLGCMIFKGASPNITPPYYVARLWPRFHYTMGGLAINKDAQVISFDLKPIAGLYAAGGDRWWRARRCASERGRVSSLIIITSMSVCK